MTPVSLDVPEDWTHLAVLPGITWGASGSFHVASWQRIWLHGSPQGPDPHLFNQHPCGSDDTEARPLEVLLLLLAILLPLVTLGLTVGPETLFLEVGLAER